MSATEFQSWVEFWKAHPFDDEARYLRPAARLLHAQIGGSFEEHLRWMRRKIDVETVAPPAPEGGWSQADLNTFKALGAVIPRA